MILGPLILPIPMLGFISVFDACLRKLNQIIQRPTRTISSRLGCVLFKFARHPTVHFFDAMKMAARITKCLRSIQSMADVVLPYIHLFLFSVYCYTPPKFNMEPENHPLEKEKTSSKSSLLGSMLIFGGVFWFKVCDLTILDTTLTSWLDFGSESYPSCRNRCKYPSLNIWNQQQVRTWK